MLELIKQCETLTGQIIRYEESGDYSHIEIKDAQLMGILATSIDIKNITFIRCDLTGSKFDSSQFNGVTFEDCNLTNCDFTDVIFGDYNSFNKSHGSNITFIRASILNQLYMERVAFDTCFFNELKCEGGWLEANYSSITNSNFMDSVNLQGNFKYTNFEGSDFSHLDLGEFISGAYQINMSRTILGGSWLSSTSPKSIRSLHMALMVGCNLRYVNLKSVDLSYANMSNAIITNCSFEDCVFDHVLMNNSSVKDTRFQYGCITCCDLRNSELIDVNLHNVDMDLTNMVNCKVDDVKVMNCRMDCTMMHEATFRALMITHTGNDTVCVICTDTNMVANINTLTHKLSVKPISDIPLMKQVKLCYTTESVILHLLTVGVN